MKEPKIDEEQLRKNRVLFGEHYGKLESTASVTDEAAKEAKLTGFVNVITLDGPCAAGRQTWVQNTDPGSWYEVTLSYRIAPAGTVGQQIEYTPPGGRTALGCSHTNDGSSYTWTVRGEKKYR